MRSERHRAGSRKNKQRKHHGRKRRTDTVPYRRSDDYYPRPWTRFETFAELLATPNQEPTSTTLDEVFGKVSD